MLSMRRRLLFKLLCTTVVVLFIIIFISGRTNNANEIQDSFTHPFWKRDHSIEDESPLNDLQIESSPDVPPANSSNWLQFHRNRSLALGRNSQIIYNRFGKSGSKTVLDLIRRMSTKNHFEFRHSRLFNRPTLAPDEEIETAKGILRIKKPSLYDRHLHFINFENFTTEVPFYINVVREPISRYVSLYYYVRAYNQEYYTKEEREMLLDDCVRNKHQSCDGDKEHVNFMIPFFCGSEKSCLVADRSSIQRAKHNAEKYYAVVGMMEDFPNFFKVLEYIFPQFFSGASRSYREIIAKGQENYKNKEKTEPQPETVTVLNKKLKYDMEFYEFVKMRFYAGLNTLETLQKTSH